jgi:glycosyltransferase involved in cell wall biosynthesis
VYWHADITSYPLLKKLVAPSILQTLKRANRIIVSDESMITASSLLNSFEAKCSVAPYGADLKFWSTCSATEEAASRMLRQQQPRMILAIGRLVRYKGFDSLLRALVNIEGEAVIIGEGPLLHELKALAQELGVLDRVTFKGRLEPTEIKAHLYAARVLAFPSVTAAEAFGLVQLEAMATGLPVVNTSLPTAVPRIARHDREGLTVPPNEPESLAKALEAILSDIALANRLGSAAKVRALSEYSQAIYISRIEQIYGELLQERRSFSHEKA